MDEGDMRAHHFIVERLAELRPDDAILSEEGRDGPARLSADRVWVVDPLDGTNEYGQPGRSDWAVHIALAIRGEPLVGAVEHVEVAVGIEATDVAGLHLKHNPPGWNQPDGLCPV